VETQLPVNIDEALREKVKKFTVIYNQNKDGQQEPTEIIIVPTGGDLSRGFELAKELLAQNLAVRLIGEGVNLRWTQPAWVRETGQLWLTELGAYHTKKLKETDWILQKDIKSWLNEVLGEVITGHDSGKVFLGSALTRLFASSDNAGSLPVLSEIVELHGVKNYYYIPGTQVSAKQIEHLIASVGGTLKTVKSMSFSAMRLRIVSQGFAWMAAVILRQLYFHNKEKPSRLRLNKLKKQHKVNSKYSSWAVLFADFKRMNSMVVNSFVLPALENKEPVGILLAGRLVLGEILGVESREQTGNDNWTGLSELEAHLPECRVEQIVSVESWLELFKLFVRFLKKASAAIFRIAWKPTYTGEKFKFDFSENWVDLITMLTQDVYQALSTEIATDKATLRNDFQGATVVFAVNGAVPFSIADAMLQSAGATTIDFIHGIPGTWLGMIPSISSIREVQIKPNIDTEISAEQKITVTKTRCPTVFKQTNSSKPARNILLTTSYALYFSKYNGNIPWLPFQKEMLSVVPIIRELFPDRFQFRWRAHPWDWKPAVEQTKNRVGNIELSEGRLLNEDLEWADIVISSFSTVLGDALWYDVPVFLHTAPLSADIPAVLSFDSSRRFFLASEIRLPFLECVKNLDSGNPEALAFEKQTRRAWFETAEDEASNQAADFSPARNLV
jgi:hypothetical protein